MPQKNHRFLPLLLIAALTLSSAESLAKKIPAAEKTTTAPAAATVKTVPVPVTDEAERIYQQYSDALYQIQVIDLTSGKKSSIGSGFQFTAGGMIATNYHVVAEALQEPATNRLEYLRENGEHEPVKILMVDVIHDLAIVQMQTPGKTFINLGTSNLAKGTNIFSLGNPHDLGMTVIEGTFSGLSPESFTEKIHFSGSLNPGMSGGPVLSHDGRVIGVNVATAGNQLSFLVPVEPLRALIARYMAEPKGYDFTAHADEYLQDQLLEQQQKIADRLLKEKWEPVPLGDMIVPGRIDPVFKCWGSPTHTAKDPFTNYRSICSSQEGQYLDEDFNTGSYLYQYDLITGKEGLNLSRFNDYYEQQFSLPLEDYDNADEKDVTNFKCSPSFVKLDGSLWKVSFCVRQYLKYPKLFDMHLYMALVGTGEKGMLASFIAEGVSKENALKLSARFMSEIKSSPVKAQKASNDEPGNSGAGEDAKGEDE